MLFTQGVYTKLALTYLQPDPAGCGDSYTLCWGIELEPFQYQGRPPNSPLGHRTIKMKNAHWVHITHSAMFHNT